MSDDKPYYKPGWNPPVQKQGQQPGLEAKLTDKPYVDLLPDGPYLAAGKLKGKKAIVTGGDSGIGRATVVLFALEGADSVIVHLPEEDEDAKETTKIVQEKTNGARKVHLITADVGKEENAKKVVDETLKVLGGLDILVNNAAQQQENSDITTLPTEQWLKFFGINIHSQFYLSRAAIPHMKPGSAIINNASINPYIGHPKLVDYTSTKGAIIAFTRALSNQIIEKRGIRVNAVCPGPIWTPLIPATMSEESIKSFGQTVPMNRPGQPVECATCFVFLASSDSSYISGQSLHPNGGRVVNG